MLVYIIIKSCEVGIYLFVFFLGFFLVCMVLYIVFFCVYEKFVFGDVIWGCIMGDEVFFYSDIYL